MSLYTTLSSVTTLLLRGCRAQSSRCHPTAVTLSSGTPSRLHLHPGHLSGDCSEAFPLKKPVQLKRLATCLTDQWKLPYKSNCLLEVNAHARTQWRVSLLHSNRNYTALNIFLHQILPVTLQSDLYRIAMKRKKKRKKKRKIKNSLPKKPGAALFFLIRYMVQEREDDTPNCLWFMFKSIWEPGSGQTPQKMSTN